MKPAPAPDARGGRDPVGAATLERMARRHEYVDLRYPNGFAVRMPEAKG